MWMLLFSRSLAAGGLISGSDTTELTVAMRTLLLLEPDEQATIYIEAQYRSMPDGFVWLLPIDGETEIEIAPAPTSLLDDIDIRTEPTFWTETPLYSPEEPERTCGCHIPGCDGPYHGQRSYVVLSEVDPNPASRIDILQPVDLVEIEEWLSAEGYLLLEPSRAAISGYLARGMQFLAVTFGPDDNGGRTETIAASFGSQRAEIPLLLTSATAIPMLDVVVSVLGEEGYVPENYVDLAFDYSEVSLEAEKTDYWELLYAAVEEAGGQAWNTEFRGHVSTILGGLPGATRFVLSKGSILTRFHTVIDPDFIGEDPRFVPDPDAPEVDHQHITASGYRRSGSAVLCLGALAFGLSRRFTRL